jgi:TetR/AcrR family transcriptional regulator, lmrAB and yxaGH operons repressor
MGDSSTRARFIAAMASLLRERGYAASSISDIIAQSGAPKGSLYFHFPGGKEELALEAIAFAAETGRSFIAEHCWGSKTLSGGFEALCDLRAQGLEQSQYSAVCLLGAVAEETLDVPAIREAVAATIRSWLQAFAEPLRNAGASPRRAEELANLIYSITVGSGMLAKRLHSIEPFNSAKRDIARILEAEGLTNSTTARKRTSAKTTNAIELRKSGKSPHVKAGLK